MALPTKKKYAKMTERLVADTSLLINFFNGHKKAIEYMEGRDIWVSGITEIELLASAKLLASDKQLIRDFLTHTFIVDLVKPVKENAILLRSRYKLKLSDSIIAATAMYLNTPLYTFDKDFKHIAEIADLVIIDL